MDDQDISITRVPGFLAAEVDCLLSELRQAHAVVVQETIGGLRGGPCLAGDADGMHATGYRLHGLQVRVDQIRASPQQTRFQGSYVIHTPIIPLASRPSTIPLASRLRR